MTSATSTTTKHSVSLMNRSIGHDKGAQIRLCVMLALLGVIVFGIDLYLIGHYRRRQKRHRSDGCC